MVGKSTAIEPVTVGVLLKRYQPQIAQALPKHIDADRLLRLANNAIQKSQGLKECTPMSLLSCVVECAQLGLEPDPVLGEIYLVPFKKTASIIVGYKGFTKLIYQSGDVFNVQGHVVRKGDRFAVSLGSHPKIEHVPIADHAGETNNDLWTGVYVIAQFRDGNVTFEYLQRADVFRRRDRSQAWRQKKLDSPWFTDEESMWRKSAIRAIAGSLPKSTTDNRLARAVALDQLSESGALTPTPTGFELAAESDRMIADGDPANGGDIQEARELPKVKQPAKDNAPIDVKPAKPKDDPPISKAQFASIFEVGQNSGSWNVDSIRAWVKSKYDGRKVSELRASEFPRVMQVMESGE